VVSLSGVLLEAQKVRVRKNSGAVVGTRPQINLIEGTGIALTVVDDGGGDEVDIVIDATSSLVPPLSRFLWVDPNTAVPTLNQNGSIAAPFASITQAHTAIAAAAVGTSWVVYLMPGFTYTFTGAWPAGRKVTYASLLPDEIAALGYPQDTAFPEAVISTSATLTTTVTSPDGQGALIFRGVDVTGTITVAGSAGAATIAAYDSDLAVVARTQTSTGTLTVHLHKSVLRSFTGGASGAGAGVITGVDAVLMQNGAWDVNSIDLLSGAIDVTSGTLTIDGVLVRLRNVRFQGAAAPNFAFPAGALATNIVEFDDITRASFDEEVGLVSGAVGGTLRTRKTYRFMFFAEHFNNVAGGDWALNSAAELGADTNNNVLTVARFDGGAGGDEGVGLNFDIPVGCTQLTFEIWYRRESGTTGTGFQLAVYSRYMIHNSAVTMTAWTAAIDVGEGAFDVTAAVANENWLKTRFRVPLSTLSLVADSIAQIELIRDPDDPSDNVAEDLVIRAIVLELD
jgi:hypothetical protein